MTTRKSLGQIAYEADPLHKRKGAITWEEAGVIAQAHYEILAQAVARAVRRRGKGK